MLFTACPGESEAFLNFGAARAAVVTVSRDPRISQWRQDNLVTLVDGQTGETKHDNQKVVLCQNQGIFSYELIVLIVLSDSREVL